MTDPESGLMYIANGPYNATYKGVVLELNPKTGTVNATSMPVIQATSLNTAAWSTHLRSMVFQSMLQEALYHFYSERKKHAIVGWKQLNTTGSVVLGTQWPCLVSAYGGSSLPFWT